jgi:hypothetical protein
MLNDLECPVMPDLAAECKQLLNSWSGRKITNEFDIDLCRMCFKYNLIIEYRWRPEPSMPQDWSKYIGMNVKDRRIFMDQNPTFMIQGKVAEYLTNKDRIINVNKRNMALLLLWLKLPIAVDEAPGLTEDEHQMVEVNLNSYSGRMN